MKGVGYREVLIEFLWPKLTNINLENIWFQQDRATPHFTNQTIVLLRQKFPGGIISRH